MQEFISTDTLQNWVTIFDDTQAYWQYSNNFDNSDFISLLEKEKQKLFDVNKIHFAMNGNWQNNETHIHKITDEQQIVKWFQGILRHIRTELE